MASTMASLRFWFSGFDGFVYNAHGLFFGAADLGLSGLAAIGGPSNKTGAHQRSTDNDCHHHLYDGQCQVDSLLELQFLKTYSRRDDVPAVYAVWETERLFDGLWYGAKRGPCIGPQKQALT
ncbi:MAG: hypothetical protein V8Q30_01610 [Acutalibacteraceae bacterium]